MKKAVKRILASLLCAAMLACSMSIEIFADSKDVNYTVAVSSGAPTSVTPTANTPVENKFKLAETSVNGQEYILLDAYDSTAQKKEYLILTEYCVPQGIGALDSGTGEDYYYYADPLKTWAWSENASSENYYWNPSAEGSTANFLNSAEVVGATIDSGINAYAQEHTWQFEQPSDCTVKAAPATMKYSLLSGREYVTYAQKIGYETHNIGNTTLKTTAFCYLRSPHKSNATYFAAVRVHDDGKGNIGKTMFLQGNALTYVPTHRRVMRPCFYISEDFFKNVKLDMSMGDNVKSVIINLLTDEEGIKLYGEDWYTLKPIDISDATEGKFSLESNGGDRVKSGYTLSVSALDDVTADDAKITYIYKNGDNWYSFGAEGSAYTIENKLAGTEMKAVIEKSGAKYITNSLVVGDNLSYKHSYHNTDVLSRADDDEDYEVYFKKSDSETLSALTLVKRNVGSSLFLTKSLGTASMVSAKSDDGEIDEYQVYSSKEPRSIAYRANAEEYIDKYVLPTEVQDYIKVTPWEIEGSDVTSAADGSFITKLTNDTVDFAKLAMPSYSELRGEPNYNARVGCSDALGQGFLMRTPRKGVTTGVFYCMAPSATVNESKPTTAYYGNRFEFNLDDGIFKEMKLDVEKTGFKAIRELNLPSIMTEAEAAGLGYSANELAILGYGGAKRAEVKSAYLDGSTLHADVSYINYGAADNVTLIMGVYDGENRLQGLDAGTMAISGDSYETVEAVSFTLPSGIADGQTVKLFVWDGDNMHPISKVFERGYKNIPHFVTYSGGDEAYSNTDLFEYNGRWQENEEKTAIETNWVRPYVDFSIVGRKDQTKVTVKFAENNPAMVKLILNGKAVSSIKADATSAWDISDYIVDGINNIRIMYTTASTKLKFTGAEISGATGYLSAAPETNNILFIGDSISEQQGYTYLVPKYLGVDSTVVAKSGIAFLDGVFGGGINELCKGMSTKFYDYGAYNIVTGADGSKEYVDMGRGQYDFESSPDYDIIFINIGTNDRYTDADKDLTTSEFAQKMDVFLKDLAVKYPNANIVLMRPILNPDGATPSRTIRGEMFDLIGNNINGGMYGENVHYFDTSAWNITMAVGDLIHPNYVGYQEMADKIISYFKQQGFIGR